ncbi:MAG: hypothetical protein GX028_03265 [Clostridiaceae bacterium]|nr:hypothetical protein [Clostridiaceae bacterium]
MKNSEIFELSLSAEHLPTDLEQAVAARLNLPAGEQPVYSIVRRSIDARRKNNIIVHYAVRAGEAPPLQGLSKIIGSAANNISSHSTNYNKQAKARPVVIGFGPAGMFAALYLAQAGLKPIVIERGNAIEQRQTDVDMFWQSGILNEESNVQFGEGGAGTFSDGKLTTRIKDDRCGAILEELVMSGAPEEIIYQAKPHIGTDILKNVVRDIRLRIIESGGEIHFGCKLKNLDIQSGQLRAVIVERCQQSDQQTKQIETIIADRVILALGHSARDTFKMLEDCGAALEAKPFAMGMRIEHPQLLMDRAQFGAMAGQPALGPADYKLAVKLPSGRSVYSFCMCPGGEVILASSEAGGIATNGMSFHSRSLANANSALLVGVGTDDFPSSEPLAGIELQRQIERRAWTLAGSNYAGISQRLKDFLPIDKLTENGKRGSEWFGQFAAAGILPSCRPAVIEQDPADLLPEFIWRSIAEAIPEFDRRLHGFAWGEAILTGPETRSSSPVRILRGSDCQSSISGLIPCGEGAGYAGGIMSAAVDGIRCAQALTML